MQVSVQIPALLLAGYPSALAGLADLGLRRCELDVTWSGDALRLNGDGWSSASLADEAGARAYRQALFDHGLAVSALHLMGPPAEDADDSLPGAAALALQAADILGAPVVCLPGGEGPRAPQPIWESLSQHIRGRATGVAFTFPSRAEDGGPPRLALGDAWDWLPALEEESATGEVGVSVDVAALFARATPPEAAWETLRAVAPYARAVVCGAADLSQDEAVRPSLAESRLDYARVAAVLGRYGYSGAFAIPPAGQAPSAQSALRADAAYLKDLLGEF